MQIRTIGGATAVALVLSALAATAQDTMSKPMAMGKEKTYTGCLQSGPTAGTFMLAHPVAEMAMGKDAMGKGAMGKDAMGKDAMGKDAMGKDAMGKDAMGKDAMAKDAMGKGAMEMPALSITSKSIDLTKHLGHKIAVTGAADAMSKDPHAFSVSALKMIAAPCGS